MPDPLSQASALLRAKAQRLLRLAEAIEAESEPGRQMHRGISPDSIDLDTIKTLLGNRAMRRTTIAAELGIDESGLDLVLTKQNGFTRNERGWYRCMNDSPSGEGDT